MAFSQNIDCCEVRTRKQEIFIKGGKPHKLLLAKAGKHRQWEVKPPVALPGRIHKRGVKTWILLQRREII